MANLNENEYLADYLNFIKNKDEFMSTHSSEIIGAEEFIDLYGAMVINEEISKHVFDNPFYNSSDLPDSFNENFDVSTWSAFHNYEQQFSSLYRFWKVNKGLLNGHFGSIDLNAKTAEEGLLIEQIEFDNFFFIEQLQNFIISMNISLLENFLVILTKEVATELNLEVVDSFSRKPPIPDKYINWLKDECDFEGLIQNKNNNKKWDAIRTVRNRFIHAIDRGIPLDVKVTLDKISNNTMSDSKSQINSNPIFVEFVFFEISTLVKKIQNSFLNKFYN